MFGTVSNETLVQLVEQQSQIISLLTTMVKQTSQSNVMQTAHTNDSGF